MEFKKILRNIFLLPALPLMVVFACYIMFKIIKQSGINEVLLKQSKGESVINEEITKELYRIYPKHLNTITSSLIWIYILIKIYL